MAATVVTAASVLWVSGPKDDGQTAGEAFAAGAVVFRSGSNGKWYKGQNDGAGADSGTALDAAGGSGLGVALFTADAAGAKGSIARPGSVITMNAVLSIGVVLYLHQTAGSMGPVADLASTNHVTPVALPLTTSQFLLLDAYHALAILA
jgi:hypothetical protein